MTSTDSPTPEVTPAPSSPAESVIIRPWPKVVFLYPTFVVATIYFLLSWLDLVSGETLGNTFMVVLLCNLLVFSFDFSRIKSITMVISGILVVVLILWLDTKWDLTGYLGGLFGAIHIVCNAPFYGFLSGGLGLLLLVGIALAAAGLGTWIGAAWLGHTGLLSTPFASLLCTVGIFLCFTPMHDAVHGAVAPKWRTLNTAVGMAASLPSVSRDQ